MPLDIPQLRRLAALIRADVVRLSHHAEAAHLGSCLSCVDLLVGCYATHRVGPGNIDSPDRDRVILSKGHAAMALYATLSRFGFLDAAPQTRSRPVPSGPDGPRCRMDDPPHPTLLTLNQPGSTLSEQPSPGCLPGVELATGSLGHGLPVAVGLALAARIQRRDYRTTAILSDGECNEGSVWEAAMLAPAQKLGSLTVLVDFNKWQATGRSTQTLALEPLADKWRAFGWEAREIDGHDLGALVDSLAPRPSVDRPRPLALIAHTTKGKGVSFMQDDNNWHYRIPTEGEVDRSLQELLAG